MTTPFPSFDLHHQRICSAAFDAVLETSPDLLFIKDATLRYVAASHPFLHLVGLEHSDQIIGKTDLDLFIDEAQALRYISDDRTLLSSGKDLKNYIESLGEVDGHARYGSTSKYILRDRNGEVLGLMGVTRDITQEYLSRLHYQQELKYLFELPADTFAIVFVDIDTWRIVNQRRQLVNGTTMQSCQTVDQLLETALSSIDDPACEAARFYQNFTPDHLRHIYEIGRRSVYFEYTRQLVDGTVKWVHNDVRFLTDPESGHLCAMLIARDIDEARRHTQELETSAKLDKMTMLLNRQTTEDCIRQAIQENESKLHALFMLDMDNFKSLNDTQGHQAGDEFLVTLARELRTCFRDSDIVGRMGGDEFFAFMTNIPSPAVAETKARTLLTAIQRVCADYPSLQLSASIGISLYPHNGQTLESLYAAADSALYQAKRSGKNQFIFAPL